MLKNTFLQISRIYNMSFWQIMSVYHSLFHRVEMLISGGGGGGGG